jgi:DNA-binding transcriptional regulator PaaX
MGWLLLVYKVPSEPSRARVAVWRELKRLGGLYLQQAVCILPARPATAEALLAVRHRIEGLGGTSYYFEVDDVGEAQEKDLIDGFRELSSKEYAEIVRECEAKFTKEIEFERFRGNYTFEDAEDIRQDLEKIKRWRERVLARDWFGAAGAESVDAWLARCEELLEEFEADVYERTGGADATPA